MESFADNPPLVVIVGQTASGKSSLALTLARRFDGEIIAADSRTVYVGMDIGTAKPSIMERQAIPHHLIDVVRPDESFTVVEFQRRARQAIAEISARGKLPILVGGTGLYIDAVVYNFSFRGAGTPAQRIALQKLSVDALQAALAEKQIPLPANARNPRHLIRALETMGGKPTRSALRPHTLILSLSVDKDMLEQNVRVRVDDMVARGLVQEIAGLAEKYGWALPALQATGYKAFRSYLAGAVSLEQAKAQFVQNDMRYAKRQRTWFKRDPNIYWISKTEEAVDLVTTLLNK